MLSTKKKPTSSFLCSNSSRSVKTSVKLDFVNQQLKWIFVQYTSFTCLLCLSLFKKYLNELSYLSYQLFPQSLLKRILFSPTYCLLIVLLSQQRGLTEDTAMEATTTALDAQFPNSVLYQKKLKPHNSSDLQLKCRN